MKKKILLAVLTLLLLCFGALCWLNLHNANYYYNERIAISREEALRACPEIEITENDLMMASAALELSGVQEALECKEIVEISKEEVSFIQETYAPDAESFSVGVLKSSVCVDLISQDGKRIILNVFPDRDDPPTKTIGVYRETWLGGTKVTVYENEGSDGFYKNVGKRDWLYFLKE